MSRIFISYRRDDSLGHVGWLRSLLIQRFGADQIFRDIDTIPPGVDFVEAIETAVGSCEVLLAVIGPRWLTTADRPGQRRLDNPEDFVRIEIATALERNIRVIPVLVQDAHMPRSNDLPSNIAKLARRNAIDLRDSSWEYDVGRLGDALETILQTAANQALQPSQQVDALFTQLILAEGLDDWDMVITSGEQILELDPNHQFTRSKIGEAYYKRGNIRYDQGDLQGALAHYEQAIKLNPRSGQGYNGRGVVRFNHGDLQGALADCEQAIKLDPNFAKAYNSRGRIRADQGDLEGALADYNQAIKLDPNSDFAYCNRGIVRYTQGDRKGAIGDYDQAIQLNPNYADAYIRRGIVQHTQDDLDGALADYDQAIKLNPKDAITYSLRGLALYTQNDFDGALADYDQAIKLQQDYAIVYTLRGLAYLAKKNRAAARDDFERAAQLGNEAAKKELAKLNRL